MATKKTDTTVELIDAYRAQPRNIEHDKIDSRTPTEWAEMCARQGGFNPITKKFTKLKVTGEDLEVYEALDAITAAAETGIVDKNSWSTQLFSGKGSLEAFFNQLECYDDCYRITDRWWHGLAALTGTGDEEDFVSCSEIVRGLRKAIESGEERKAVLMAQSKHFAANPMPPLEGVTEDEREALLSDRYETETASRKMGQAKDISCQFAFRYPVMFVQDGRLFMREATKADVDASRAALAARVAAQVKKRAPRKAKATA